MSGILSRRKPTIVNILIFFFKLNDQILQTLLLKKKRKKKTRKGKTKLQNFSLKMLRIKKN